MEKQQAQMHPRPARLARFDAVVVGAGPYGLSVAAHLRGRGLRTAVFGKPVELWREHMPKGMLLRSWWWAANLSDPERRYTFEEFFRRTGVRAVYPVPLDTFVDYALWFQRNAVPEVDETYVTNIEPLGDGFRVSLEDGRCVETDSVVMATGLQSFANLPEEFQDLPRGFVFHSSDVRDPQAFRGRHVLVVGGGQSAVEYAALLAEAGATVDLVSRHPIVWLEPDRYGERGLLERCLAPDAGIGPGWRNWILEHVPQFFYHMPSSWKERMLTHYSRAWAAHWLRARVADRVKLHEGSVVTSHEVRGKTLDLTLSDGSRVSADCVILATGYRVDIDRISILSPALRAAIRADRGVPVLSSSFETSVPGLCFVGASSTRSFGPMYRFVLGCRPAARRVARRIERRHRRVQMRGHTAPAREDRHAPSRTRRGSEVQTRPPADEGP